MPILHGMRERGERHARGREFDTMFRRGACIGSIRYWIGHAAERAMYLRFVRRVLLMDDGPRLRTVRNGRLRMMA